MSLKMFAIDNKLYLTLRSLRWLLILKWRVVYYHFDVLGKICFIGGSLVGVIQQLKADGHAIFMPYSP